MSQTRGKLVSARIYEADDSGEPKDGGISVDCMFNPFEYTVSKSNTFDESSRNSDVPRVEFKKAGAQTLRLVLVFDTYEADGDVSKITRNLWKLMETKNRRVGNRTRKVDPPQVVFKWGVFQFQAVITNMTQKFTLFKHDGTPVRASVDITFSQYIDKEDYPRQNPTSGGGPINRIYRVIAGERLDTIAYQVYQDASKWRLIAEHNQILDPLEIIPGTQLRIPLD